jgi:hypothetical protein
MTLERAPRCRHRLRANLLPSATLRAAAWFLRVFGIGRLNGQLIEFYCGTSDVVWGVSAQGRDGYWAKYD